MPKYQISKIKYQLLLQDESFKCIFKQKIVELLET